MQYSLIARKNPASLLGNDHSTRTKPLICMRIADVGATTAIAIEI
ncbi:MAG: hypothetical protein SFY66_05855 [Oculatellaceae cyanobacterium bins.114]|nr:hypothetical protein [Oculatellaceae cyanobacterium bins.114]